MECCIPLAQFRIGQRDSMLHPGMRSPDSMIRPSPRAPPPISPQHFAPMTTRTTGMMPGGASTMRSRARARAQQQRAHESMMWPNPWLRRNWHAVDLNAEVPVDKEAEENEMLLEEPEPEENKFKPAFDMDLHALVESLWTPPVPSPAADPFATRRPQFVRQRSTSPPPMAPPKPTLPSHNVPDSVRDVRRANHIPRYDDMDMCTRRMAPDPRMRTFEHRRGMAPPPVANDSWFDEDDEPFPPPRRYDDPHRLHEGTRPRPLDPRTVREMETARQQRSQAPNLRRMHTSPPFEDRRQYVDDWGRPHPMPINHRRGYDPRMRDVDPRTQRVYEAPRAIPREMDALWDEHEEQFDHRKHAYDPRVASRLDPRTDPRMMDPRLMRRMESDPRSAAMDPRVRVAPPQQHRELQFHPAPPQYHHQPRDPRAYVMGRSPPRASPFLGPYSHDAPPPPAPVMTRSEPDRAMYHDGVDF